MIELAGVAILEEEIHDGLIRRDVLLNHAQEEVMSLLDVTLLAVALDQGRERDQIRTDPPFTFHFLEDFLSFVHPAGFDTSVQDAVVGNL